MYILTSKSFYIYVLEIVFLIINNSMAEDNCESMPTEIHVTKDEYDDMGRLIRSCTGEVTVNKCEGMCKSQVWPSRESTTGFLKQCFCCRENFLRDRQVTLTQCYDPDGVRIEESSRSRMEIQLREPAECECYKCGDFSI